MGINRMTAILKAIFTTWKRPVATIRRSKLVPMGEARCCPVTVLSRPRVRDKKWCFSILKPLKTAKVLRWLTFFRQTPSLRSIITWCKSWQSLMAVETWTAPSLRVETKCRSSQVMEICSQGEASRGVVRGTHLRTFCCKIRYTRATQAHQLNW